MEKWTNAELKQIYTVCFNKGEDQSWQEIAEILNDSLDRDYNESAYRKVYQSFNTMFEAVKDDILSNETMAMIDQKTEALKKEKIKTRDSYVRLNQAIREVSRYEAQLELIQETVGKIDRPKVPNIKISPKEDKVGVLCFGDSHFGKELQIKGLNGEVLNEYNPDIFEQRLWELRDETISIIQKEELTKIVVFDLGDAIEGILRISTLQTLKYGAIESAMKYAMFMSTWLNDLSNVVHVEYYGIEGNHDETRVLTGKKGDFPHENLGRFINQFIKADLKHNANITVGDTIENKMIFKNICGYNVMATHGEEKNKLTSIREYEDIYDVKINYLISGHSHHAENKEVGRDKEYIGCGSIIGIDDYSIGLKRVSNASAKFLVLTQNKGKIEYTIKLN